MTTLTAEQIEDRRRIVIEVDAAVCNGCGTPVPDGAPESDGWFIDSEADPSGVELAEIRCPECW